MTTSDLSTALRRALTTLVNSPSWNGGLRLNATDKALLPEERLAARLVRLNSLQPAIDVEALAASMADITDKRFPVEIDGLCLDLKVPGKRPKIWVSKSLHHKRRRFTLAHEIGHIIIPWHTGSIVDDLEAPRIAKGRYKVMEAQANRFAAELLMPSDWMIGLKDRCEHLSGMFSTVYQVADVSFEAALFRTVKFGDAGYLIGEVRDGILVRTWRTRGTRTHAPENGTQLAYLDLPTADAPAVIRHGESRYFFWQVDGAVEAGDPPMTPWRDIIADILTSVPLEHQKQTLTRVNAIVGYAVGRLPKGSPVDELYGRVLAATKNRVDQDPWLAEVINDKRFDSYILARCYDRAKLELRVKDYE